MKPKVRYFTIAICLLIGISLNAENSEKNRVVVLKPVHTFSFSSSYGFLLPHHPIMRPMVENHFFLNELSFTKSNLNNSWSSKFHNPEIGLSLLAADLRSDIMGKAIAVYPFINFPLIRKKPDRLHLKTGIGLGYLSEKFDLEDNWQNVAIGSNANIIIALGLNFNFNLSDNFRLRTGPGFTHFSNGATSFPNLGINLVDWKLRLEFGHKSNTLQPVPIDTELKSPFIRLTGIWGIREIKPIGSRKFHAFGLSAHYYFQTRTKFLWTGGLDLNYNTATKERILRSELKDYRDVDVLRLGVSGGIALDFETWYFTVQMGVYAIDQFKLDGLAYHRFGFLYDFNEKIGMNFTLKTHYARADHVEAGITYKIMKK